MITSAKVTRATCQIKSWLSACNIPHAMEQKAGKLVINVPAKSTAKLVRFLVHFPEEAASTEPFKRIEFKKLTSPKTSEALAEFHRVTEAAGYGKPNPLCRPEAQERASFKESMELAVMRHMSFRRVPNPPDSAYGKYEKVIEGTCKKFFHSRWRFLNVNGIDDLEDLRSYAMVWVTIFIGLFEDPNESKEHNCRILAHYLKQRLSYLGLALKRKGRSCRTHLHSSNENYDHSHDPDLHAFTDATSNLHGQKMREGSVEDFAVPMVEDAGLPTCWATHKLNKLLAAMDHDDMVAALTKVADNVGFIHGTAEVRQARKRLDRHVQGCPLCKVNVNV